MNGSGDKDDRQEFPRLHMVGEALLVVEFGACLTPAFNDAAIAFDNYVREKEVEGLQESMPANRSVALRFDPLHVDPGRFRNMVEKLLEGHDWFSPVLRPARRCWRLPVSYGGAMGPDLEKIADRVGLSPEKVVAAHLASPQRVFMIGFAPGFLYTGMLPEIFQIPRLQKIKPRVEAGSVSVAVGQSVISSTAHPTGWYTIGRTPFVNFNPRREPPCQIVAGDEISFVAIDEDEFEFLHNRAGQGLQSRPCRQQDAKEDKRQKPGGCMEAERSMPEQGESGE